MKKENEKQKNKKRIRPKRIQKIIKPSDKGYGYKYPERLSGGKWPYPSGGS